VEDLSDSFAKLKDVAAQLNAASDELLLPISALDGALKRLNLGVSTWVRIAEETIRDHHWSLELGYDKVGSTWGLSIRETDSDSPHGAQSPADEVKVWLWPNAPRSYRVEAVEHLPSLLLWLRAAASGMTEKVRASSAKAKEMAATFGEPL
jgi:hypothetical protein